MQATHQLGPRCRLFPLTSEAPRPRIRAFHGFFRRRDLIVPRAPPPLTVSLLRRRRERSSHRGGPQRCRRHRRRRPESLSTRRVRCDRW